MVFTLSLLVDMKRRLSLFLLVFLTLACGNSRKLKGPFDVWERTVITMNGDIMYVFVTDDRRDSVGLRMPCKDLSEEELQSDLFGMLAEKMLSTVGSPQQGGVGIAAPQVGIHRRVVAVQRLDKEGEPFEVYPNIRIKDYLGGTVRGREGCLSLPGTRKAKRYRSIKVQYQNEQFQAQLKTYTGFTAQIIQHEIDHCNGVLI
jgi:peptide deformylase